jgi:hypothetical protein
MYLSARGEPVDFDAVLIKQQLAQAPMTIDVEKRKTFIESKEVRKRADPVVLAPLPEEFIPPLEEVVPAPSLMDDFEVDDKPKKK